jgi:molybdopterin-guanine dinucleotide biosynthesis protein A
MTARPLPVVLAGGRSERFGRDKLQEPVGAGMLVDIPIAALRGVFGAPVALAGACHPSVALRADMVLPDVEPGGGPIEGIMAALAHPAGSAGIFVLAGDMVSTSAAEVLEMWEAAARFPSAWAVLAHSGRVEGCAGVYRPRSLEVLRARATAGRRSLHDAIPADRLALVPMDPSRLRNVNRVDDLNARQ